MKCFFDSCTDALDFAMENRSFGAFYSDTKNQNQEVHIHECCELFLCLKGGNTFLIDDKVYSIQDGDLFLINQFEAHKVVPDPNGEFCRYILHVHPFFLYANSMEDTGLTDCFYSSDRVTKLSLTQNEVTRMTTLFEELNTDHGYGDSMYKQLRALEILLEASRLFATHRNSLTSEFSHRAVQTAIDYINTHYASPITLDSVAKNAFISPAQLTRLFHRYCGTTVSKYIISKRITSAKKLLSDGKSVTEVAFMCGFNDYANFIRTFKNAVGVPPGKYKSNCT